MLLSAMTICELDSYVLCTIVHLPIAHCLSHDSDRPPLLMAWLTGWYEDSNCSLIIDGVVVLHECMTSGVFVPRTNNNIFCYTVADGVQSSMKCVSVVREGSIWQPQRSVIPSHSQPCVPAWGSCVNGVVKHVDEYKSYSFVAQVNAVLLRVCVDYTDEILTFSTWTKQQTLAVKDHQQQLM